MRLWAAALIGLASCVREDKAEDSPSLARKRGCKGTTLAGTLILDSRPPELWESKCRSRPVHGSLSWQREQPKTILYAPSYKLLLMGIVDIF